MEAALKGERRLDMISPDTHIHTLSGDCVLNDTGLVGKELITFHRSPFQTAHGGRTGTGQAARIVSATSSVAVGTTSWTRKEELCSISWSFPLRWVGVRLMLKILHIILFHCAHKLSQLFL